MIIFSKWRGRGGGRVNRRNERFGVDHLVVELEKLWQEPPSDLLAKLADRVDRFRGTLPLADDATAVALRVIS